MDVARAPMGYRDVPSGRASVAGEFARVARLHRARMSGQAFLVTFCGGGLPPFDKSDSPEGAKQKISADSERRATPSPQATWVIPLRASASAVRDGAASRVRGNDDCLAVRAGVLFVGAGPARDFARRARSYRGMAWVG